MDNVSHIRQNMFFSTKLNPNYKNLSKKSEKNQHNSSLNPKTKSKLITPNANQVLAFCGGKSLNLAQTYNQIKTFGAFPSDIEENITEELKKGNPKNKTLIDIHREKYDFLNQMDSLEEAKLFFPEFSEVLSDSEITYYKNSFIDKVKSGKLEYFDSDKDIALQLLQIYWGDGFSLNDIKNNFTNTELYNVFKKFNIPLQDSTYAHYLKLSDKKYNERFSALLSQKISESKAKSTKKQENSQNFETKIPKEKTTRKPLSEEHRRKISQSLIEYYKQNPREAAEITEESLKCYKSKEEKEIFSQIMIRAWNYNECRPVKKAMSKYMKRDISDSEIKDLTQEDSILRKNLSGFYKKNPWAKAQLSKAMKKSWERQRELNDLGLNFDFAAQVRMFPTQIAQELEKLSKISGLAKNAQYYYLADERDLKNLGGYCIVPETNDEEKEKIAQILNENTNNLTTEFADILFITIINYYEDLINNAKKNNNFDENFKKIDKYLYDNFFKSYEENRRRDFDINKLQVIYSNLMLFFCYEQKNIKEINKLNAKLDESYKQYKQNGVEKSLAKTRASYEYCLSCAKHFRINYPELFCKS